MKAITIFFENNTKIVAIVMLILVLLFFFTPLYKENSVINETTAPDSTIADTCTFMIFKTSSELYEATYETLPRFSIDRATKNLILYNTISSAVMLAINMALVLTLLILSFFATRYATALLAGTILPIGVLFAVFGGMAWMNPSAAFFFIFIAFVISVLCVIAYVNKATITRYARIKALAANKAVEEHTEENTEAQDEDATI